MHTAKVSANAGASRMQRAASLFFATHHFNNHPRCHSAFYPGSLLSLSFQATSACRGREGGGRLRRVREDYQVADVQ